VKIIGLGHKVSIVCYKNLNFEDKWTQSWILIPCFYVLCTRKWKVLKEAKWFSNIHSVKKLSVYARYCYLSLCARWCIKHYPFNPFISSLGSTDLENGSLEMFHNLTNITVLKCHHSGFQVWWSVALQNSY
jgi:hypothetical protein